MLLQAAKDSLGLDQVRRSAKPAIGALRGSTEISYDDSDGNRVATIYIAADGTLRQFVVNQPDSEPYTPVRERGAFLGRLMAIAAPETSAAERAWGAEQLQRLWGRHTRPLPVQVGSYVFRGMTVSGAGGTHDTFWIHALDTGYIGLRYRPHQ